MREPNYLLPALFLAMTSLVTHGATMDPKEGYIGISTDPDPKSGFFVADYVVDQGPAAEAGIRKGDLITAIDDHTTRDMTSADMSKYTNGEIGATVTLAIKHSDSSDAKIALTRRSIFDTFGPAANAGDTRAQTYLGYFYENATPPTQDYAKAAEWYRKAADLGRVSAQMDLALLYRRGRGVAHDEAAATALYTQAAAHGGATPERELGICYYDGRGVAMDYREAFNWLYAAARQDDARAECYLANLYHVGHGVPQDEHAAFAWYYRSAMQGYPYAQVGLAYLYEKGQGVDKNSAEAYQWFQKAQAALPDNQKLREHFVAFGLARFIQTGDSRTLDLPALRTTFHTSILLGLFFATGIYVAAGAVLVWFTFRRGDQAPRLAIAIGWIVFYIESQVVATLASFFVANALTADMLIVAISLFGAVPVIASTLGPHRATIWKAPRVPLRKLVAYGAGFSLLLLAVSVVYAKLYALIMHAPLDTQSTRALFVNAKHSSYLLTFASVGLAMPVAEEIMFRSYLFEALRKNCSGAVTVILTALAFSLVHFQGLYFVVLFGLGAALGWARLKTGSLYLPIILHAANNCLSLAAAS